MREIIFDTETTGLDSANDRIVEFGGVELDNRFPTGRSFHVYINPQGRPVHPEALAVHGLSDEFLSDKPTFAEIAAELVEFVGDAILVAHNANFDLGFVNAEFQRIGLPQVAGDRVIDTLAIARRKHPMGPNSLDALCRRYGIDNSRRTKHGALLDSELLAEVYIELIGGKQAALVLEAEEKDTAQSEGPGIVVRTDYRRPSPLPPRLSDAEHQAHSELVARIGDKSLWLSVEEKPAAGS
jgi:DNA polymerase-3 subunit epsilon